MAGERLPLSNEQERRLDRLIAEYLATIQTQGSVDREQLFQQHPDLADALREFFADEDHFHQWTEPLREALSAQASPDRSHGECSTEGFTPRRATSLPPSGHCFGDYELIEEIARGGMGVVYRANQVSLGRPVALKMILAGGLASDIDIERFHREAEAAARLDHPHIVPIYDVGQREGHHYFSMKLIEGGDLTRHMVQYADRPRATAALMADVAEAVHHAHQRGILHRDLKPRNILIDSNDNAQITDFGLAKLVEASEDATQSGAIVGTAGYMAPEQARADKSITTAADIYSLGAVLYELLTGRPPFRGSTPAETILQVLQRTPERPRMIRADIDPDLETICLKCLENNAGHRYSSAAAVAEDLRRWLDDRPITARPIHPLERLRRWCRRNPTWAIGSVAIVSLMLFLPWWFWRESRIVGAALQREHLAVTEAQTARDQTQDLLARSLYEQARALARTGVTGSRWQVIDLLRDAEQLRRRERETERPAETGDIRARLPSQAELRCEAVRTLLRHDLRLSRSLNVNEVQPGIDPSGTHVAIRSPSGVSIVQLAGPSVPPTPATPPSPSEALAVDPTGKLLAAWQSESDQLSIDNLQETGSRRLLTWPESSDTPTMAWRPPGQLCSSDLAWSPQGDYLAVVDRRRRAPEPAHLVLWQNEAPHDPRVLAAVSHDPHLGGPCFHPSENQVAFATGPREIAIWNTVTGELLDRVQLPSLLIGRIDWHPNGRDLACPCAGVAPPRDVFPSRRPRRPNAGTGNAQTDAERRCSRSANAGTGNARASAGGAQRFRGRDSGLGPGAAAAGESTGGERRSAGKRTGLSSARDDARGRHAVGHNHALGGAIRPTVGRTSNGPRLWDLDPSLVEGRSTTVLLGRLGRTAPVLGGLSPAAG